MTAFNFKKVKIHEYAKLWPMMNDEEFKVLVEQIKKNGLRKPIEVYENKDGTWVIDGRNRLKACEVLGIEPKMTYAKDAEGELLQSEEDVFNYVLDTNVRRNPKTEQRAAIALNLFETTREDFNTRLDCLENAAFLCGVSSRNVIYAQEVKEKDLKVFSELYDGNLTLPMAIGKVRGHKTKAQKKELVIDYLNTEVYFEPLACDHERVGLPLEGEALEVLQKYKGKTIKLKILA